MFRSFLSSTRLRAALMVLTALVLAGSASFSSLVGPAGSSW